MQSNEETFVKYAVDANLFRLGSTNPKKKYPGPGCFLVGGKAPHQKYIYLFFSKMFQYLKKNDSIFFFKSVQIQNRLNQKKNQISDFSKFLFFRVSSIKAGSNLRGGKGLHILSLEKSSHRGKNPALGLFPAGFYPRFFPR